MDKGPGPRHNCASAGASRMSLALLALLACDTPPTEPAPTGPAVEELHGRLDTMSGRDVLYLWGTREEMGYAEGALLCDRVAPLFEDYLLEHLVAEYTDYTYDIVSVFVTATVLYEDGDYRELEAMWEGMQDHCSTEELTVRSDYLGPEYDGEKVLGFEDLLFANAIADFGCSSFSAWGDASATGDTIHGRNFDWAVDRQGTFLQEHVLKVYESEEEGGARWASLSVPGLAGCITCVTEEGVGLTMHNVSGLEASRSVDISPRIMAARAALAATWGAQDLVGDAEAVLESRQQIVGSNLHLSFPTARGTDGSGAVVFEYDGAADAPDGQVTVLRPGDDPDLLSIDGLVATNHFTVREEPETSGNSFDRHQSLIAAIDAAPNAGGLNPDLGRTALVNVAQGGYTAHSILIDTANRELRVFVAPDPNTMALEAEPNVIDLDELFGGLP